MNATITLHVTADDTITALPRGSGIRWAETALALAGFTRHDDGRHVLPLHPSHTARISLARLPEIAALCGTTLVHSDRPHIGEVADHLTHHLPGTWSSVLVDFADDHRADPVYERLWEGDGPVHQALEQRTLSWSAVLTAADGQAFVLAEHPDNEQYLAAALLDDSYGDTVPADATAPPSIITTSAALLHAVSTRLLPAFDQGFPLHLPTSRDQARSTKPAAGTTSTTAATALPPPAAPAPPARRR
ncbi:hypothetical protein ACFWXK_20590 [Streptomyces sp. NPDC059070]|uniref:hypothetical protein n=1 Tax=Streptomyces sp. NPDC059070 TaxID=3346713 RepID=UPI0036B46B5A